MASIAVSAEGLSKRFMLSSNQAPYGRLTEALSDALRAPFRRRSSPRGVAFWALRDVSFEIPAGAAVGIIGRNGAGKSTLLKILSRITAPTAGSATLHGRVASLLDVGTGFHPELSGTENIYLSGAVLGMRRVEIQRKFDEIVAFSGIDSSFLDTPVKRYSSGMQVRLGFAVAAHLESEILIVDEVLAVGDMEFQKRCLGKMDEVANSGRTILFVSHQLPMVATLCDTALLMDGGKVVQMGKTTEVINRYQSGSESDAASVHYPDDERRPGDGLVSLLGAWIEDAAGGPRFEFSLVEPVRICIKYRVHKSLSATPQPNVHVTHGGGTYVFVSSPHDWGDARARTPGDYVATVEVPGHLLNDGLYSVGIALNHFESGFATAFFEQGAITFNVVDSMEDDSVRAISRWGGQIPGVVRPLLDWQVSEAAEMRSGL